LVHGRSVDEVKNFVERNQVDVLVIGGPKAGSWRGPEPATTERLLSVVECDVLIVPCSVAPSKTVVSLS